MTGRPQTPIERVESDVLGGGGAIMNLISYGGAGFMLFTTYATAFGENTRGSVFGDDAIFGLCLALFMRLGSMLGAITGNRRSTRVARRITSRVAPVREAATSSASPTSTVRRIRRAAWLLVPACPLVLILAGQLLYSGRG